MYASERISLCLQSCILAVLTAAITICMLASVSVEKNGVGRLTITVERLVSESPGYEIIFPNLFLEIEAAGVTRYTTGNHSVREVILKKEFVFETVDYRGSIMFRLRDAAHSTKPCRGLLAITASDAVLNRYSVYKMDALNWIVMKIEWRKLKEEKSGSRK